jgi:hypothetical protein
MEEASTSATGDCVMEDENEDLPPPASRDTRSTDTNFTFTMYKRADKIHPVSGTFPEEARVCYIIPEDPLQTLSLL